MRGIEPYRRCHGFPFYLHRGNPVPFIGSIALQLKNTSDEANNANSESMSQGVTSHYEEHAACLVLPAAHPSAVL